jgi:C-terminal processing protease CtpA/Prc
MGRRFYAFLLFLIALSLAAAVQLAAQSTLSREDKGTDLLMLKDAKQTLQKYYYDPQFHGVVIEALYSKYEQKVQASQSNHDAFAWIAAFVDSLKDSHTRFLPPRRAAQVDYGFTLQMIGNKCYVTHTRPGSDAAAKLHIGDQIVQRDGVAVSRGDFPEMLYYFDALAPVTVSRFDLIDPSGGPRSVQVDSTLTMEGNALLLNGATVFNLIRQMDQEYDDSKDEFVEHGDVFIWKMHEFTDDPFEVDAMFSRIRKHKTLILDLRGNPGGSLETLQNVLALLLDHDTKIADRTGRKKLKPVIVKSRGSYAFSGKLIVLIDSDSASAAEILPRVVQLESRGTVVGDRSSGQVMEAEFQGGDLAGAGVGYGFEVTVADLIMNDGKSIEHVGVTPDQTLLPTAQDLASGRDPVLGHAAQLAGWDLTPEDAGKLFPYKWLAIE